MRSCKLCCLHSLPRPLLVPEIEPQMLLFGLSLPGALRGVKNPRGWITGGEIERGALAGFVCLELPVWGSRAGELFVCCCDVLMWYEI